MYRELLTFIGERCPKDTLATNETCAIDLKILQAIPNSALYAFIVNFVDNSVFQYAATSDNQPIDTLNEWTKFFSDSIPDGERGKMGERIASVYSFIVNEFSKSSRHNIIVYEDFHIRMMGLNMLVTQKFIPIDIDVRGNVTVGMFVITPSVSKSPGKLNLCFDGRVWAFNQRTRSLVERKMITISDSEMKMMMLSRKGLTVECIADRLSMSVNTIKTLRKRVYKKLGVDVLQSAFTIMDNYSLWRVW